LSQFIIGCNQVIPFGKVFVHGLRGGRSNRVGVLPNLRSDVEQRDHYRKSADDLSEISEVVEIHAFSSCANRCRASAPLAKAKMSAGDAPALQFVAAQLAFVLRGIEMAVRFRDKQEIISKEQLRF
jgi:hypothetical protein